MVGQIVSDIGIAKESRVEPIYDRHDIHVYEDALMNGRILGFSDQVDRSPLPLSRKMLDTYLKHQRGFFLSMDQLDREWSVNRPQSLG